MNIKELDIYPILIDFKKTFVAFQLELVKALYDNIEKSFEYIMKQIPNGKSIYLTEGNIPKYDLLKAANEYYEKFMQYFVYEEDLLNEPDINRIVLENVNN